MTDLLDDLKDLDAADPNSFNYERRLWTMRFFALFMDFIIYLLIFSALAFAVEGFRLKRFVTEDTLWTIFCMLIIIINAIGESGREQATFGKQIVGLKVVNQAKERLTFGHALWRNFLKMIVCAMTWVALLLSTFVKDNRFLHEILSKTYVIKT